MKQDFLWATIFGECSVFFDKGRLIILLNGFQKKSQKTPKKEIDLAIRLMKEYYENKKNTSHEKGK